LRLRLKLGDAPAGRNKFGVLAGSTGHLAGVDQMLAAPDVNRLLEARSAAT
jgi:hypothetical protein